MSVAWGAPRRGKIFGGKWAPPRDLGAFEAVALGREGSHRASVHDFVELLRAPQRLIRRTLRVVG